MTGVMFQLVRAWGTVWWRTTEVIKAVDLPNDFLSSVIHCVKINTVGMNVWERVYMCRMFWNQHNTHIIDTLSVILLHAHTPTCIAVKLYSNLGYHGVSVVAMATMEWLFVVMWLLCSSFLEVYMNFAQEVRRSFHSSPHFSPNFYHTPSTSFIIPPLTAPSHSLSASHITLSPSVPFPPCLSAYVYVPASLPFLSSYLSTPPSSFIPSPTLPSISFSPCSASLSVSASCSPISLALSRLLSHAC